MKIFRIYRGMMVVMLSLVALFSCNNSEKDAELSLYEAYEGYFVIGAALNTPQISGEDSSSLKVIEREFNSIVAENCMKSEVIQPEEGRFDFELSDKLVALGLKNEQFIVGHTLIWHSQAPSWFFVDEQGELVSRDVLIERMKTHIYTVVGRYKGKVNGWDVVNEALLEDGGLRESLFYQIIGPEYLELAFEFAHEADPEAELYYNDYNMYKAPKRDGAIKLVERLKEKGLRIDAIGMQGHYGLGMDVKNEIEESILAIADAGVQVMVTELDISVLPFPSGEITAEVSTSYANSPEYNPYTEMLPDSVQDALSDEYAALFELYLKHSDKISRVTFWGVNDSQTWRNYWPVSGRTDYPLIFDRDNVAKPVHGVLIDLVESK